MLAPTGGNFITVVAGSLEFKAAGQGPPQLFVALGIVPPVNGPHPGLVNFKTANQIGCCAFAFNQTTASWLDFAGKTL